MGAILGGSVGLIMGFIYGGFNIFRYGAGPNGVMRTLGQNMLGMGTMFGCVKIFSHPITLQSAILFSLGRIHLKV